MNSQYNFSYSGSDVKALIKNTDLNTAYKVLNTLTTVSFSVNEQKTPVRRLGRRHVVGFTKAIRTIAGTMVLTVLKGHPLTELYKLNEYYQTGEMGQGVHRPNSYHFATNVPPFDLKLIYQTEHNSRYYAELVIKGIEIISQSIVTSVNDMVTECVLQFVARDYDEFINHVSNVTEDTHAKVIAEAQIEEIKIKEEIDSLNQADSLVGARDLATSQDIRTMVEYLENLRKDYINPIPENIELAISKFKDINFDLLKKYDKYYNEAREKAKQYRLSNQKNDLEFTEEEVENFRPSSSDPVPSGYFFPILPENKKFIPSDYKIPFYELPLDFEITLNEVQDYLPNDYEFTLNEVQNYLPDNYEFTLDEIQNYLPNDYNFTLDQVENYLPNDYEFTLEEIRNYLPSDYPLDGLPDNYIFILEEVRDFIPNDYNFNLNEVQDYLPNDYEFTLDEVQNFIPNDFEISLQETKEYLPDDYKFTLEEIQNFIPNDFEISLQEAKNYIPNDYKFTLEEVIDYLSKDMSMSNKNQQDEKNKLVNGITKSEQDFAEEQGKKDTKITRGFY